MKLIGVQEKKGEYQGTNYHNIILHVTKQDDNALGAVTETVKVKRASVTEVFGKDMQSKDFEAALGKDINVFYNRYGTPQSITIGA